MFRRQAKLQVDIVHGSPSRELLHVSRFDVAYSKVKEYLSTAIQRQKELYDAKVHGQEFMVGDLVWLNNPVMARDASLKLHCPWIISLPIW